MKKQFWLGFAIASTAIGGCTAEQGAEDSDEADQAIGSPCTATISSLESTVTFGDQVHLTATANCPGGVADIQFLRRPAGGTFSVIQAYSAATTDVFTTQTVGVNDFEVQARTHGTTEAPATSTFATVQVNDTVPSCLSVKMTQPKAGQGGFLSGSPVSMTGLAVCPNGITPEYQFWFKPASVSNFTIIPGYTSGTGSFTPSAGGDYNLTVVARSLGAHVQYQVRSAAVLIHVGSSPVNQAPIANTDNFSLAHGAPLTFDPRSNDTDGDSDALTITAAGPASNGTATFTATSITYTPTLGFAGSDSLQYTISDGHSHTASATVNLTVTNNAPTTTDDATSTFQMTAVTIDPRSNDKDLDDDALSITAVGAATSGATSFTATGVTYTPAPGFVGEDSFSYTISDGFTTASGTVTVSVTDRAPTAGDDSTSTSVNTAVLVAVLSNDSDPDLGDGISLTSVTTPGHGTALIVSPGCGVLCLQAPLAGGLSDATLHFQPSSTMVRYTPTTGYSGTDSFSYTITDHHGLTATATVTLTVNNGAPTANADTTSTLSNTPVTFDPTANDTDPDQDALVITAAGPAANGSVAFGNNTLTYTPATNFIGTDTFSYTISDGTVTAIGSITITVDNQGPTANGDAKSTNKNTPTSFDPTSNDSDPDGGTLSVTAVSPATNGTTGFLGNTVTYTPNSNYVGGDSFSYTMTDGQGSFASATVTMTVVQLVSGCTISLSSLESTVVWGNPIHLNAIASCNTGLAQVQWLKKIPGGAAKVIVAWADSNTSIQVTAADIGDNQFTAQVRTKGTTPVQATSNAVTVAIVDTVPSCTSVKMTSPITNTHVPTNGQIFLTASAICPLDTTAEYQYWMKRSVDTTWTIITPYTQGSAATALPAGTWNFTAVARSVGAHVTYQVRASQVNVIVDAPN